MSLIERAKLGSQECRALGDGCNCLECNLASFAVLVVEALPKLIHRHDSACMSLSIDKKHPRYDDATLCNCGAVERNAILQSLADALGVKL